MISSEKIDEWIREVEERSSSAPAILRFIANRLSELAQRNEELLAENLELQTGEKVEQYESRIANLEYQLEILKRQFSESLSAPASSPAEEMVSALLYTPQGRVLRVELGAGQILHNSPVAQFKEAGPAEAQMRLLATSSQEELLFIFDSGRTATVPVGEIPATGPQALDWQKAHVQDVSGLEELVAIQAIGRMSLFESCVQVSRRAFVKKIKESFLETYIANNYIGTGVKLPSDKTCDLILCNPEDLLVLVSKEGFVWCIESSRLPFMIEEAQRLRATDHIVAAFCASPQSSFVLVTRQGKAVHREGAWLESATSLKTRGKPLFSKERRAAGDLVVGAGTVRENEWAVALLSDGALAVYALDDLLGAGTLLPAPASAHILGFATFGRQA